VNQTGVKLGLVGGAHLSDPKKLLRGTGKSGRHVVIKTPEDLETPGLRQLIRAALAAWKKGERNPLPATLPGITAGVRGMRFIERVIASNRIEGWVEF